MRDEVQKVMANPEIDGAQVPRFLGDLLEYMHYHKSCGDLSDVFDTPGNPIALDFSAKGSSSGYSPKVTTARVQQRAGLWAWHTTELYYCADTVPCTWQYSRNYDDIFRKKK